MSELIRALTLVEGRVLSADFCRGILLLLAIAPTLWGQDTPLWSPAARMLEPRTGHCAIALPDGRLLIAGGTGSAGPLASVEFYGPEDQFRAGPQMSAARTGHRCTILNDGRLLVSGGAVGNSAEVFDPSSGRWSQVGGDVWSAQNHTATLLPGGQVLLAGGVSGGAPSTSIVSFDPASDQLRILVVPLMEGRTSHSAELLPDGRVLFAGGVGAGGTLRTVELLNPTLPRIVPGPDLQTPRSAHGSLNLPDGRILVVGGTNGELDLDNAEVYNPGDNTWRWVNALMASARKSLLTVPLPSGKFLLAGGDLNGTPLGLTETFDPETFVFERAGYLTAPRADIAGAVLPTSGLVLATGGRNDVGPTNLCGILTSSTIRLTDSSGVVPAGGFTAGQTVYLSGSGFSSFIKLALSASRSDDIIIAGTRLLTASLLTAGTTFRVPLFTVVESDLGKTITAVAATPVASVRTSTVPSGRVTLSVTGPSSSPLYSLYQYDVIVRSATPGTPISGFLTVSVSGSSVTRPFAGPFNTPIAVRGCCMQTAGTFTPKITFVPDNANYAGASATGPSVTIPTATQLTSRDANTVYPLFQTVARDWLLTGDAGSASAPNPTGQVTITSTQGTAFSITLPLQSFAPKVSRFVLPFKATFEDRTSPCRFNFSYSGDAFYPPMSGGMCLSVVPAVPTLTASAPPFL
ncbi:MAG: hypothetical protein RL328_1990, partial [Acidobacteriota bacterium]